MLDINDFWLYSIIKYNFYCKFDVSMDIFATEKSLTDDIGFIKNPGTTELINLIFRSEESVFVSKEYPILIAIEPLPPPKKKLLFSQFWNNDKSGIATSWITLDSIGKSIRSVRMCIDL